jgi:predicted amidohydrolase
MNLARQALIEEQEEIHAALWPALSTLVGFEGVANSQIEAMMKNHALTGQCFVIAASSPITAEMIGFMESRLGSQQFLTCGGGWTAIIHPFTSLLAGPASGEAESLVTATIDLDDLKDVKMWLDTTGHYARPEVLQLVVDRRPRPTVRYEEI